MRQTSIFAYHTLTSGYLSKRKKQVRDGLRKIQPATNRMVAQYTGIPINVVTPRMGELFRDSLVEVDHKGLDVTGRQAIFWRVNDN